MATPHSVPPSSSNASSDLLETNAARIGVAALWIHKLFKDGANADVSRVSYCLGVLARGINFAIAYDDVPKIVVSLPLVIKLAYKLKRDQSLESTFPLLTLSIKNACKSGWFQPEEVNELLEMGKEFDNYRMKTTNISEVSYGMDILSWFNIYIPTRPLRSKAHYLMGQELPILWPKNWVTQRYYSHVRLGNLILSVEAKPGRGTIASDFIIKRDRPLDQQIGLFVVKTDDLENSSCPVSPPDVSFLVNGKPLSTQEGGPQLPRDITKVLKFGINLLQVVGEFDGNYLIAIAFMSNITSSTSMLKDYAQPAATAEVSHEKKNEVFVEASKENFVDLTMDED